LSNSIQVPKFLVKEFYPKRTKYCVCIPVINEGEKIKKQLIEMRNVSSIIDIIICDGGSNDKSLQDSFLINNNISVLLTKIDKGKLSSQLRMGYNYALERGYEGIITIDGNGKDNVNEIPKFIKELENGYDFIQGSRFIKGGKALNTPLVRLLAIKLIHAPFISILSGFHYTDTTNGFRGYSKLYLTDCRVQPFRDIFSTYELLAYLSVKAPKLKFKVKEVPVERKYPTGGLIPTKIKGLKGNLNLLVILILLAFGKYEPK